jgi:SHS2 domain-containing protein
VADRRLVRAAEERFLPVPPGAPADSLPPFLRAVLLLLSAERFLVRSATPLPPSPGEGAGGWRISLRGEPAEPGRHRFLREVKAVTRHAFEVERVAGGEWRARFVLDV